MAAGNKNFLGSAITLIIGIILIILPWIAGIEGYIFGKVCLTIIGVVMTLVGLGQSNGCGHSGSWQILQFYH